MKFIETLKKWLKRLWRGLLVRKSRTAEKVVSAPAEHEKSVGMTKNYHVKGNVLNRIRDTFNPPALLKSKNNWKRTAGRFFYYLQGKKRY